MKIGENPRSLAQNSPPQRKYLTVVGRRLRGLVSVNPCMRLCANSRSNVYQMKQIDMERGEEVNQLGAGSRAEANLTADHTLPCMY